VKLRLLTCAKGAPMTYSDDNILPRPVEVLPEYAHARSRQALAEKLTAAFNLSETAASIISNAVVDPSDVRRAMGEPTDPGVERLPVPGGVLLGLRTMVWAPRVMPDPRNPRILPARRHPFAVDPGTGGEESKFRPIPEPKARFEDKPQGPELSVDIENRHHLIWASEQAAKYILEDNDWRKSIASQGVMEAVWLVATTYNHLDEYDPVTTLTTVEGSSRVTAVHSLLSIRSADVPYDDQEQKFRSYIKRLNEKVDNGATGDEQIALRCLRIPALILVGFEKHPPGNTGFATAVKSMVALRHVDPPKPWGEGPENESLADEVLDELYRQNLISETTRAYFAGSCTRSEAEAAHLSPDPPIRASQIAALFMQPTPEIERAIRIAVTSQSTRKKITTRLMNELSTALILRAYSDVPVKVDQVRRYLRYAFGKAAHSEPWRGTDRSTELLVAAALEEVRQTLANPNAGRSIGPFSLELAVRAAYPLIVSGRLNADRGTNSGQPDRRTPGELLDTMRQSQQGVLQLGQALRDFGASRPIRAVDENGEVKLLPDNAGEQVVNDFFLRDEYPPAGRARAPHPGDTPRDHFNNRISMLSDAVDAVYKAFTAAASVPGDDGRPFVETSGLDQKLVSVWREQLGRIDEELLLWGRMHQRQCAASAPPVFHSHDDDSPATEDVYAEAGVDDVGQSIEDHA
jgi:hypothetical protein